MLLLHRTAPNVCAWCVGFMLSRLSRYIKLEASVGAHRPSSTLVVIRKAMLGVVAAVLRESLHESFRIALVASVLFFDLYLNKYYYCIIILLIDQFRADSTATTLTL